MKSSGNTKSFLFSDEENWAYEQARKALHRDFTQGILLGMLLGAALSMLISMLAFWWLNF